MCRLQITMQLRYGAVDKMAGIFAKRIWQSCICQPNDLKIKKKLGGQAKIWERHDPPRPPLKIATDHI